MEKAYNAILKSEYKNVLKFANSKHIGQKRKTGELYIHHPIRVFILAEKFTQDKNVLSAALLHDCIEDTDTTLEEIAENFGPKVAGLVKELTLPKGLKHADQSKADYLSKSIIKLSDDALLLKLCDRLDNLHDIKILSLNNASYLRMETQEMLHGLAEGRMLNNSHKELIREIYEIIK